MMALVRQAPVRYSDEINDKLIKWMNDTGYNIVQINGQRISTSPRVDRKPSRGCEVFVGKIPRDCYEDELFPIFQTVGAIHELRLMMMFSGTNRGYAFVMYERLQDAQRAVHELDNYEVRRGHRIGVLPCVNNCRLFIGCFEATDLPEHNEMQLHEILRSETEHLVSVSRRSGRNGRWYLLVEYLNHRAAAIARRELTPRRTQLFGPRVIVDWEIPLDKRGRKLALDQRRAMKSSPLLKLYKPIGNLQLADSKVSGKLNLYMEKSNSSKTNRQMLQRSLPPAASDAYQEMWMRSLGAKEEPLYWPSDIIQSSSLNPSVTVNEIYSGPTTRQNSSGPHLRQDLNYFCQNQEQPYLFGQLLPRAQQGLMRSTDSSLYSDPDCQRPLSSESSGSSRSSCSLPAWDGSMSSSNSIGSSTRSYTVNWERNLSNELTDSSHSDSESRQMLTSDRVSPWQSDELPTSYYCVDLNGNKCSVWSSKFHTEEDHELIDNLFSKEEKGTSDFDSFNKSMRALTVSTTSDATKRSFGRAVEPPQSRYLLPSRGSTNSNLRRVF